MEDWHHDRESGHDYRSGAENTKSVIAAGFEVDDVDDQESEEEQRTEGGDPGPFELSPKSGQRYEAGVCRRRSQNADRGGELPEVVAFGFGPDSDDKQERVSDGQRHACRRKNL